MRNETITKFAKDQKWNDARYVGGLDYGDKIYYKGDMSNISGWATVTDVKPCDSYHEKITIKFQDGRVHIINPYILGFQKDADQPIFQQGGLHRHVIAYKKQWGLIK
tara:strand:- start:251 stop:571 length:321 start_codon:yes stop_codon:yes gene_type:complete